jgi:hypothetical protein
MMQRIVAVETLDGLAEDDPQAIRSRSDLQRVHLAMGTRLILLRALKAMQMPCRQATPLRWLEIGAGDGSLMLSVAQALAPSWPQVELTLLDRQNLINHDTIARYAEVGWTAVAQVADIHDWASAVDSAPAAAAAAAPAPAPWDLIISNLFLHHFEGDQLVALLSAITLRGKQFLACEPRRDWLALAGSHLTGVIGANAVTRLDAVLSVHAGFCSSELSALWPRYGDDWQLQEYSAGLFSHCFRAERARTN